MFVFSSISFSLCCLIVSIFHQPTLSFSLLSSHPHPFIRLSQPPHSVCFLSRSSTSLCVSLSVSLSVCPLYVSVSVCLSVCLSPLSPRRHLPLLCCTSRHLHLLSSYSICSSFPCLYPTASQSQTPSSSVSGYT